MNTLSDQKTTIAFRGVAIHGVAHGVKSTKSRFLVYSRERQMARSMIRTASKSPAAAQARYGADARSLKAAPESSIHALHLAYLLARSRHQHFIAWTEYPDPDLSARVAVLYEARLILRFLRRHHPDQITTALALASAAKHHQRPALRLIAGGLHHERTRP